RKAAVQIAEKWVNRHPEQKDSFEDLLYAYAHQAEPHEVTGMPSSDPEAGRAAVLARSGWRHIVSSCSESELPPSLSGALPPPRECLARCRRMVAERPNDYQVLMCLERIIYLWHEYRNRRKAKRSSNHHRRIHQHLLELHRKARTAYASEWHGSLETTRVLAYSLWSACRSTHANDDLSLRLRFVADLEHVLLLESRLATIAAASGEDFDSHLRTVIRFHDNLHQGDSTPPSLKTAFSRRETTAERLQEWAASFAEALSHDEASMHALKSILDIIGLDANNTETTSRFLTVSLRFLQQQTRTTSDRPNATEGAAEVPDFMMAVASHCAANRSRAYAQSLQEVVLGILVAGVGDRRELRPPDPLLSAALSSLRILVEAGALDLKNPDDLLPLVQFVATDESWTSEIRITATRIIGNLLPVLEPNQATEVRSWMIRALEQAYAGEPPASDHNSWQSPIGRQCEQDRNYILAERKYRLPGFEERVSAIRQRRIEILERELENSNSALDSDEKERRTEDIQSWLSTFLRELAAELREQGTSQGHASAMAIEKRRLDLLKYAGRRIDRLLAKRTDEYQSTVHQILMDLRQCAIPMGSPEVYAYACKGAAALDRLRLSHPRWFRRMMGDLLWFHWMAAASAVSADRPDAPRRLELLRDACRIAASDATYQGEGPNAQEYIGRIEAWLLNVTCSSSEVAE
ncbi:MAG TPA: hypothetical protein PKA37_10525, partial [Planctomycetota bacterium]|nr:hypothetical protein [Planctomycetota bacterium]